MRARFAVAAIGEHRLGALFDCYGRDTVQAATEEIFHQSEHPGTPGEIRRLKTNRMALRKGDNVRCYTGGGGGYGNPLERDPQALLADLADGHISPDYARRHHRLNAEDPIND